MKVVFTTNDKSESIYELLKTAINSLKANTTLSPYVVWSGKENHMTKWLTDKDVGVVYRELSFNVDKFSFETLNCEHMEIQKMYQYYTDYYNSNFIYTESLRIDLPIIFNDEWLLYCDCDVLFLGDPVPELERAKASNAYFGAVLRDDKFFNNGVMFLNLPMMRECREELIEFYLNSGYSFKIGDTTTQGLYNTFFENKLIAPLDSGLNWHSFWGKNDSAKIIHWCGPKPQDFINMWNDKEKTYEIVYELCSNPATLRYIHEWNKYAENPISIP